MEKKICEADCIPCQKPFVATMSRTTLGFRKLECPECGGSSVYPLPSFTRTLYWGIALIMAAAIVGTLANGGFAFPGLLGIAVTVALVKDYRIKAGWLEAGLAPEPIPAGDGARGPGQSADQGGRSRPMC